MRTLIQEIKNIHQFKTYFGLYKGSRKYSIQARMALIRLTESMLGRQWMNAKEQEKVLRQVWRIVRGASRAGGGWGAP